MGAEPESRRGWGARGEHLERIERPRGKMFVRSQEREWFRLAFVSELLDINDVAEVDPQKEMKKLG